jgi:hypothetical protein
MGTDLFSGKSGLEEWTGKGKREKGTDLFF